MKIEDLPKWQIDTLKENQRYLEAMGLSYTLEELYEQSIKDKED